MSCEQNIKEIITWLEKNQPDVFKRGLWEVIKPVQFGPHRTQKERRWMMNCKDLINKYMEVTSEEHEILGVLLETLTLQANRSLIEPVDKEKILYALIDESMRRYVAFNAELERAIKPVEHHPLLDFDAALEKAWIEHVKRYYSGIEPDIPQPKIKYTQAFRNGWDARGGACEI